MSHPAGPWARGLLAAAVLAVTAAGCASAAARTTDPPGTTHSEPAASPRPLGAADTAFGLDLLRAWCQAEPRSNLVFSPASLAAGLGMAYLGARGATAAAMAAVLHLPAASAAAIEADMRARQVALRRLDRPGVTLAASNRIWAGLAPLRSYLAAVASGYGAGMSPLPASPVRAAAAIDAAVDHDTRGHIPHLVTAGQVAGDSWVLTDALYLDAAWARPFQASLTGPGPFRTAAGGTAMASYLHGSGYRYARAGGWTAVSLPYRGGALTMTALLPPAGSSGCQVPAPALAGEIAAKTTGPDPGLAGVALPKVNLGTQQQMNSLLIGLGMGIAFSGAADFTGLSPAACCISFVEHAATLQVTERGTVGSAATAVGIMPSSLQIQTGPQIDFDRPYLMLVTATGTGEPLFIARVTDPAAG